MNIFFKLKTPDFQKCSLYSNSTKRQILQFWIAFISSNLLVKILFCFFVLFAKVFQTAFQLWRWLRWKGCCLHRLIDKKHKNWKTNRNRNRKLPKKSIHFFDFVVIWNFEQSGSPRFYSVPEIIVSDSLWFKDVALNVSVMESRSFRN